MDMTGKNSCMPMRQSHFSGNGSCDKMREANKRADRWTGMESEIAPVTAGEMQAMQNNGAMNQMNQGTGAMSSLMPYGGTNGQMMNSGMDTQMMQGSMNGQMMAGNGADPDSIPDGYGMEHDHPTDEEEGMSSIPQDSFDEPLNADEAARNSWRALLARNVGRNVLVRFLMGTQNMVTVEGELYEVGTDYIVIYQPLWDSHITADLYSVKFVEFREPPGVLTLA